MTGRPFFVPQKVDHTVFVFLVQMLTAHPRAAISSDETYLDLAVDHRLPAAHPHARPGGLPPHHPYPPLPTPPLTPLTLPSTPPPRCPSPLRPPPIPPSNPLDLNPPPLTASPKVAKFMLWIEKNQTAMDLLNTMLNVEK